MDGSHIGTYYLKMNASCGMIWSNSTYKDLLMTNEQKLIRECLDWLIDFQVTANLNDNAWESLGDLIERCHDALRTNEK